MRALIDDLSIEIGTINSTLHGGRMNSFDAGDGWLARGG